MRCILKPHPLEAQPGNEPGTYLLIDPSGSTPDLVCTEAELQERYQPLPEPLPPPENRLEIARRIHAGLQQAILASGAVRDRQVEVTLIVEQLLLLAATYAHMKPDDHEETYIDFARECHRHVTEKLREHQKQEGPSIIIPPTGR